MLEHVSKELRRGMYRRFIVFILSIVCFACRRHPAGCKASREYKILCCRFFSLSVHLHRLLSALTSCTCSMRFTIFRDWDWTQSVSDWRQLSEIKELFMSAFQF